MVLWLLAASSPTRTDGPVESLNTSVAQGEGGEQGDPFMPKLFALGQRKSLVEAQARLSGNEKLLAFVDDIYIASMPDRVLDAHTIVQEELSTHAHLHLHHGKTKVWNRGGVEPEGIAELSGQDR